VALICDHSGQIKEVIRNDFEGSLRLSEGQVLSEIVDSGSRTKTKSFLTAIATNKVVMDCELDLPFAESVRTFHFMGSMSAGDHLVIAASSRGALYDIYEEITKTTDAHPHDADMVAEVRLGVGATEGDQSNSAYNELSRLNNELANLQRILVVKDRELELLNEQKNRYLGMAAHDLRNPLSVIATYSTFLLDEAAQALDAEQQKFVTSIRSSSDFMLNLINDLLDVSTIESGELELKRKSIDLVALVEQNAQLNGVLAQKKGIEIEFRADENLPEVELDPRKLEQVVNILFSNAIKYSRSKSRIRVSVARGKQGLVVAVADEGPGIPPKETGSLFEAITTTSTDGEKNTGLGLMIARKIIDGHGGRIWVESEVGRGSTFSVSLPLTIPDAAGAERSGGTAAAEDGSTSTTGTEAPRPAEDLAEPAPEAPPAMKILLAEDDRVNRTMTLHVLKRLGYAADVAVTGVEVLRNLEEQAYDVVLMDLHMPEMDGFEATRQIREKWSEEQRPTIVALTASDSKEDMELCWRAGMDAFLTKPVKMQDLRAVLGIG